MKKTVIIYDSKYGNTRLVAEMIAQGMNQVEETQTTVMNYKEVAPERLHEFDAILIGSPNHFGRPSRTIRKFINEVAKQNLVNKKGAVFDTYINKDFEKATERLAKQIDEKIPGLTLITHGLSILVSGTKGPIADGEDAKCREFGGRVAALLRDAV